MPRCCRRTISASWHGDEGLEGLPSLKGLQEREEVDPEVMYRDTHFRGWVWGVHAGTAAGQSWRMGFCIASPGDEHPSNNKIVQQVYA